MIEFHIQSAKARRKARGTFGSDGEFQATVSVEYRRDDGDNYWILSVTTRGPLGRDTWQRAYATRADAYAAFEWYLDRHDELNEVDK
jgi:hypothetical protein